MNILTVVLVSLGENEKQLAYMISKMLWNFYKNVFNAPIVQIQIGPRSHVQCNSVDALKEWNLCGHSGSQCHTMGNSIWASHTPCGRFKKHLT